MLIGSFNGHWSGEPEGVRCIVVLSIFSQVTNWFCRSDDYTQLNWYGCLARWKALSLFALLMNQIHRLIIRFVVGSAIRSYQLEVYCAYVYTLCKLPLITQRPNGALSKPASRIMNERALINYGSGVFDSTGMPVCYKHRDLTHCLWSTRLPNDSKLVK